MKGYLTPVMECFALSCEDVLCTSRADLFEIDENMVIRWENLQ